MSPEMQRTEGLGAAVIRSIFGGRQACVPILAVGLGAGYLTSPSLWSFACTERTMLTSEPCKGQVRQCMRNAKCGPGT